MGSRGQSQRKKYTSAQKTKADNIKKQAQKRGYTNIKFRYNENGEVEYSYTEKKNVQEVHGGKMQDPAKNDHYERTVVHSGKIGKDGLIKRNKDEKNDVLIQKGRAAERARERAEKRQATRETNKLPAGVRVTFPDGTTRIYARSVNGIVTDQYGYPLNVARGMKYNDLIQQIRNNQGKSGVKIENISGGELKAMREARQEAERNKPDYEMGIGTPWGNKDNRRAARMSRLAGRVANRRR